jgi:hypothetical protein
MWVGKIGIRRGHVDRHGAGGGGDGEGICEAAEVEGICSWGGRSPEHRRSSLERGEEGVVDGINWRHGRESRSWGDEEEVSAMILSLGSDTKKETRIVSVALRSCSREPS